MKMVNFIEHGIAEVLLRYFLELIILVMITKESFILAIRFKIKILSKSFLVLFQCFSHI